MVSKRNKKIFHVTIIRPDGTETDVTRYIPYPVEWRDTLDETYDEATFELKHTPFSEEFTPNDIALVKVGKKEQRYVIMSDTVTTLFAINKWNHTLMLCEETQLLERYPAGGGKCFTQPLVRDYAVIPATWEMEKIPMEKIPIVGSRSEINFGICARGTYNAVYDSVTQDKDLFSIALYSPKKIGALASNEFVRLGIILRRAFDEKEVVSFWFDSPSYVTDEWTSEVSVEYAGKYIVEYDGKKYVPASGNYSDIKIRIPIKLHSDSHRSDLTVYEAGKRLCETSEAITVGEKPRFTFSRYSSDGKVDYATVKCPEISISNSRMLWEAMCELARCVHAIPRLYAGGEIKFDRLGRKDKAVIPYRPISEFVSARGERYCGSVDTIAQNLVALDETLPTYAPLPHMWMTVRSESGEVRITDANAMITTEYPIYKVLQVWAVGVKDTKGNTHADVDITKFIFEASEYRTLTTSGGYPLGKPYALCYTEGSQNITGLLYKDENALLDVLETHAIYNILSAACGVQVDVHSTAVVDLAFRVCYVPIVTARVKASKSDLASHATEYVLPFNQTSDRMSAKAFSENLRGTLKRYSAAEKKLSYLYFNLDKLPEVGQKFDDTYYINDMTVSLRNHQYAAVTLGLSKNYNALGKHMSLPSEIRQYEISEKNVQDRYVVVEEYVLVSNDKSTLEKYPAARFAKDVAMFYPGEGQFFRYIGVNSVMYDENKDVISNVMLPVIALPIANSAVYFWRYKDNYSAGVMSINPDTETAESITVNEDGSWGGRIVQCAQGVEFYRKQREVEYGDLYGEAHSMGFALHSLGERAQAWKKVQKDVALVGNSLPTAAASDYSRYIFVPNYEMDDVCVSTSKNYRHIGYPPVDEPVDKFKNDLTPIVLHKDSRETICCTYQLNYVGDGGIIIGDGMAKLSLGIRRDNGSRRFDLWFYEETAIDEVNGVDPDAVSVGTSTPDFSANKGVLTLSVDGTIPEHASWALRDNFGNFIMGANKPFETVYYKALASLEQRARTDKI